MRRIMKLVMMLSAFSGNILCQSPGTSSTGGEILGQKSWTDATTGYQIIQLTQQAGSHLLPRRIYPFTSDGRELVYTTGKRVFMADLYGAHINHVLLDEDVKVVLPARTAPSIFAVAANDDLLRINVYSGAIENIGTLPSGLGEISINADDTVLVGVKKDLSDPKSINAQVSYSLVAINVKDLSQDVLLTSTEAIDETFLSPTDPSLMIYRKKEGDRSSYWTEHIDSKKSTLLRKRQSASELSNKLFWGSDGHTVWYELQLPIGGNTYLVSFDLSSSQETWLHLEPEQTSSSYAVRPDGTAFCSGEPPKEVDADPQGWVNYLEARTLPTPPVEKKSSLIRSGFFSARPLVIKSSETASISSQPVFEPRANRVIFESNRDGSSFIYRVDVHHVVTSSEPIVSK